LTPDVSRSLVKAGLAHLIVSIDTEDAESYQKQRVGGDFDTVVANIRAFAEAKREMGGRTRMVVSALMTDRLLENMDGFLEFSRSLPTSGQRFESYIDVVRDPLVRTTGTPPKTAFSTHTHFYLWRKLYIQWNGKAVVCPQNIHLDDPELIAGDLERHSVAQVWNGNRIREMRAAALRGKGPNGLCKDCGFPSHPVWMYAGKLLMGERLFLVHAQPWITTSIARITAKSALNPKTRSRQGQ